MIGIKGIASYIPAGRIDNLAQAALFERDEAFVMAKIGTRTLAVKGPDEETSDLGVAAIRNLLNANPALRVENIDALVVVTQNGDAEGLPHTSAIVQHKAGLPTSTASFDIALGCSGFVYGLYVLKGFMQAANLKNGILVTVDPYSKHINHADRATALLFGDAATAEQNWNDYAAEVEALDWDHGGRYPETRAPEEFASYTWPYYLSTRPDYRLMLQNRSLMESSCPFITDRLAEMKMESVQPYELLTALPEASKQQFYRMAKFDYAHFEGLFDLSPKKNLIIIGTSHSSAASEQQQAAYVERIIQQYGSDYDIFFKPHPADSSSAGYPDRFEGLTLLPGQMPFEIFVWALLDKIDMIGGYPSTTFISVPLDKVGFLFAAGADGLVRPLNILFRDAANVEWIQ